MKCIVCGNKIFAFYSEKYKGKLGWCPTCADQFKLD